MKAVIVGAGVAGLVAARQLGLAGWQVSVLERSDAPRGEGYMMDFFGPGVDAAERIGLLPLLQQAAYPVLSADYALPGGRRTARIDYSAFSELAGGRVLSLLRPDLEQAARTALHQLPQGRVQVHYGAKITGMQLQDSGVRVQLEGAAEQSGDLLIGADGIHSTVRGAFFGPEQHYVRHLGMRAAALIVRDEQLAERYAHRITFSDTLRRTAGIYGLPDGRAAAFLVYQWDPRDPLGPALTRLRRIFSGCGPQVDRLLELCPDQPYDDAVAQIIMPSWHRRRVVLLGDAAWTVSLLAGQGGALAVHGAAVLGDVLGDVREPAQVPAALHRYERQLRALVVQTQAAGRRSARSFLPRTAAGLWARRAVIAATHLPGVDKLVAQQIVRRLVH